MAPCSGAGRRSHDAGREPDPLADQVAATGVSRSKILTNPLGVDPDRYCPSIDGSAVRSQYALTGKLVIGFIGIYQWQHDQRISELADIDFAVLLDDAPIGAYADKGFGALLQTSTDDL